MAACGVGAEWRHDEEGRRRGAGTAASRLQVWRVGCAARAAGASGVEGRRDTRLLAAPGAGKPGRDRGWRRARRGGSGWTRRRLLGTPGGGAWRGPERDEAQVRGRARPAAHQGGRPGGWRPAVGGRGAGGWSRRRLGGRPVGSGRRLEKKKNPKPSSLILC
jgi:hypothetical protein